MAMFYKKGPEWKRVRKSIIFSSFGGASAGGGAFEDDAVYPTIVNSGIVFPSNGVTTITSTPGNFLIVFFLSRSNSPLTEITGWTNWGGYAPIRRTTDTTQRIWILSKVSTGNDSFSVIISPSNYVVFFELSGVDINNPLIIGSAPVVVENNQAAILSKSKNKLMLWAGHALYFSYTGSYTYVTSIWRTSSGMPIVSGVTGTETPYYLGVLADTSKLVDWPIDVPYAPSVATMEYYYDAGGQHCSILPVAINPV